MNISDHLLEVLREEVASCEAELEEVQNSLRYKAGGWIIEAFPLGSNTISACLKLARLYLSQSKKRSTTATSTLSSKSSYHTRSAPEVVVLGRKLPATLCTKAVWCTEDIELLTRRLDQDNINGILVLRKPEIQVLKRVERLRLMGWYIIWSPQEKSLLDSEELVAYVKAHADQCLDESCV
ncbi:hypothetical protein [Microbulbifer sp. 2205BS26-8]|uniref:hypothetical protein n=1 Tax=Microbulbifer sp. 2205BS26-8 TaxID=3064386 RepID=UPI00273D4595|nr:hypothetical protein [Microbulbifer sp. 2205BS26-8]MDP5211155.1 hypothetical protein [Microbulbifer sp. 2205BS26-8]